jgi:predicted nuclease with RNAse H fold
LTGTLAEVLAVGVDVAEERKGLDLVALDSARHVISNRRGLTVDRAAELIVRDLRPDMVCTDSPSGWSLSGASRQAERDLARLGISSFATGPDPGDHSFYRWMRVGFAVFAELANHYPLFRHGDPSGCAAEVFPNASAIMLAGRPRAKGESKLRFRRQVLAEHHVDVSVLAGIDQVDAALGALTGLVALEGQWHSVGDPAEGVILLPAWSSVALPTTIIPRISSPASRKAPSVKGKCGCGCGALVRRRFLPGHDAKLKSQLLADWREGDLSAKARLEELLWLPENDRSQAQ